MRFAPLRLLTPVLLASLFADTSSALQPVDGPRSPVVHEGPVKVQEKAPVSEDGLATAKAPRAARKHPTGPRRATNASNGDATGQGRPQSIVLRHGIDQAIATDRLSVRGKSYRLEMQPHSIRAKDFKILTRSAAGLHEHPASPPRTYRGSMLDAEGNRIAVVGSLDRDDRLNAFFRVDGEPFSLQPVIGGDPTEYLVSSGSEQAAGSWSCGTTGTSQQPPSPDPPQQEAGVGGGIQEVCRIAYDSDFDFFALNNFSVEQTVEDIETVMAGVTLIYEIDTEITYEITTIVVQTDQASDPYTFTDSQNLLLQFQGFWLANMGEVDRNVAHLMTGKDLDGTTIGRAFLSGICNFNGYGINQSKWSTVLLRRVGISSHELGHNWSAQHCSGSACNIMCPSIGGCSGVLGEFSQGSIDMIVGYRNTLGSCLNSFHYVPGEFPTIQAAVDASSDGDVVRLAPGTYRGSGNRDVYVGFPGGPCSISVLGSGSEDCTVDCEGQGPAFRVEYDSRSNCQANPYVNFEGIRIVNGKAPAQFLGYRGGGIYSHGASMRLYECIVESCEAEQQGGGIYWEGNSGKTLSIENCVIRNNSTTTNVGSGGGISVHVPTAPAQVNVRNSIISGNTVSRLGAGIDIKFFTSAAWPGNCDLTILGSTIVDNVCLDNNISYGGGVSVVNTPDSTGQTTIHNSILWGNSALEGTQLYHVEHGLGICSVNYTDLQGGLAGVSVFGDLYWGLGNIAVNPKFEGTSYRLRRDSPCINAGDPNFVALPQEQDIDGEGRVRQLRVEMGADEQPGSPQPNLSPAPRILQ